MARADSTIRVNIIGDAKGLERAAGQAEGSVSGLNKKLVAAGGIIAGAFVTDKLLDFGQTALKEADRVGDAAGILEAQLGDLAQPIIDAADEFSRLGASEGDMLDLEVAIVNVGKALGITDTELAGFATDAATAASALALITDTDADTWISQIGKAAAGSDRALRALGVGVTETEVVARALATTGKDTADALTDSELAAARLELILEKLNPRIQETITGTGDLEQKQAQLQARIETFSGDVGEIVQGPLSDLLGIVLAITETFGSATDTITDAGVSVSGLLAPVKALIAPWSALGDAIGAAVTALERFLSLAPSGIGTPLPRGSATPLRSRQYSTGTTNVYVQGGSPEVIEQSVRRALQQATGRGPLE